MAEKWCYLALDTTAFGGISALNKYKIQRYEQCGLGL